MMQASGIDTFGLPSQNKQANLRHLTKVSDFNAEEILDLIEWARDMKADVDRTHPRYNNSFFRKTLLMFFAKPSLRTRLSFEAGATQMGGHAIYYELNKELQGKKESIVDTAECVSRYVDVVIARVKSRQEIFDLVKHSSIPVINALDDWGHPAQILSDLFTIAEKRGFNTQEDWKKCKLAYCGDSCNNVTYDLMRAAAVLGFTIAVACPKDPQFRPADEAMKECEELCKKSGGKIMITDRINEAVKDADVVYTDSWMSYGIPDDEKSERIRHLQPFQVTRDVMKHAKNDAIFMNCLPTIRGMEQTADVVDGPQSVVYEEAGNRTYMQKCIVLWLYERSPRGRSHAAYQARMINKIDTKLQEQGTDPEQGKAEARVSHKHQDLMRRGLGDIVLAMSSA